MAVSTLGEQFPLGVCLKIVDFAMLSLEKNIVARDEIEPLNPSVCRLALYRLCYGRHVLLLFMWVV